MSAPPLVLIAILSILTAACHDSENSDESQPPPAESALETPAAGEESAANDILPEPVIDPPAPGDHLGQRIYELAQQYGRGLEADQRFDGPELQAGGFHDTALILGGGRCYKIIGVGEAGVEDLDLILYDDNRVQIGQDTSVDAQPVLGLTSPLCLQNAGRHRLQARMVGGSGRFSIQVLRSAIW